MFSFPGKSFSEEHQKGTVIREFCYLSIDEEMQFQRQLKRKLECENDTLPLKRMCLRKTLRTDEDSQERQNPFSAQTTKVQQDPVFPESALPSRIAIKLGNAVNIIPLPKEEEAVNFAPKKKCSSKTKRNKPRKKNRPRKDKTKYHPVLQVETKKANQVRLLCAHCDVQFTAKATYRERFGHYLVNHACCGKKRTQFVIGRKHKRCEFGCDASFGCIRFVLC